MEINITYKKYDETYLVNEYGDIYSTKSHKNLKHYIDKDGYHRVDIHKKHIKVHKLVYLTWIGVIPKGMQINHKDDNKNNNHFSNLYLGTQKENISDCIINRHRKGHICRLTIFDKTKNEYLTFEPARNFFSYSGHSQVNGSISKILNRKWFTKKYDFISLEKV